ncbi:MAG: PadR family transcriptional regulator [Desulfurococcales archaeon]|nr:PadR family transcriptional regulator [Desulfurococcales archaeon]
MARRWLREQLSKGLTALLVLVVLEREGPMHGYWLRERLSQLLGYPPPPSSLYDILKRLESEGLLESYWALGGTGKARKYYRVTEAGAREALELATWLRHVLDSMEVGVSG